MADSKRKPLLYTILVSEGALTEEQARRALAECDGRRERGQQASFGQIVLVLGLLRPTKLNEYLAMQRKLAGNPSKPPLGVLIVESGVLKPSQVVAALARQETSGKRIGELLIAEGMLRRIQVDMLLQQQRRLEAAMALAA